MRKCVRTILAALLIVCQSAQAFNRSPLEELVDPTCVPPNVGPIDRYTTFVNGRNFLNWEIRLITRGHHFNYEICFDVRSTTDFRKGLPQTFEFEKGHENPCQLASKTWIHEEAIDEFKKNLEASLKDTLEGLQTRKYRSEQWAYIEPLLKATDALVSNVTDWVLVPAVFGSILFGRMKLVPDKVVKYQGESSWFRALKLSLGNKFVRIARGASYIGMVLLAYRLYTREGGGRPEIKDKEGNPVVETTQAGRELDDIMSDVTDKTGMTREQAPILIQFIFEQLRTAIPAAMEKTSKQIGCIVVQET